MPPATVRCPICKREVPLGDPNMPFCSDRCRLIDLGNWASEKYAIPASRSASDLDEDNRDPEELEGTRQ